MSRTLLLYVLALLPVAAVGAVWLEADDSTAEPTTTLIIVRHAERTDDSANTNLSASGVERAEALVEVAREAGVTAVYSTSLCRTAQTAQPLARALSLPITVQPGGGDLAGCEPTITVPTSALPPGVNSSQALVAHILGAHPGEAVLVVGHSDTVPHILEALGRGTFGHVSISGEFDNLFVVTAGRSQPAPRLVKARYGRGAPTEP